MGIIRRTFANNITTSGVLTSGAINNNSISNVTSLPSSVQTGTWKLISSTDASTDATVSITSGITSTYKSYVLMLTNIHPGTDSVQFLFQASTDGGSNYNTTATTTAWRGYSDEGNTIQGKDYTASDDAAQSTSFLPLNSGNVVGADNDQAYSGIIKFYDLSSTTNVKHFFVRASYDHSDQYSVDHWTSGYFNTTSAINALQFKFSSGNIDSGKFSLYGLAVPS